ncbi:MAG: NAD-dependent succinate-semialdehyde dehydrogenase [Roseovarius sp.]|nr:NAD-dependent succinate-semialdehyde dehydrogenase [Roseovarius sp.]
MTIYEKYGLFIDGKWTAGSEEIEVRSPTTERKLGVSSAASRKDTRTAIDAAERALSPLRKMGGFARADAMHRIADLIQAHAEEAARIISAETGKPLAQSRREWGLACDQFRWYAEEARRIYGRTVESRVPGGKYEIAKEPVGIVGAFTAWNFPAVLAARKIAPAMAAGCPVILRPSSQTPGSVMILADCIRAAELPRGSVGLVVGKTDETYGPLMADARVRKVSLTGSTRVGQKMLRDAAQTVKKVSMELGGNAPFIIYEDADLELALDMAVPAKFANCGQVCVSPDRFFIHESRHDAFVEGFVDRASRITLGDGLDETTMMGPLISSSRLEEIDGVIREAVFDGASIAFGGKRAAGFNEGHFYEPTVLTDVKDEMRVFAEENFGPVAAISPFREEDEVISRANATEMGLAAYAFTKSPTCAGRAISALKSGMVGINTCALAASEAPFGGTGFSGLGREGGPEGIEGHLETKLAHIAF